MSTAKKKGDLLEYAVHQIEKALVANYPQLAGQDVTIEPKKIIEIDGIRHEADLWITANPGTHLESHHLIECKNQSRAVGTAEIDKLANKRDRLGAAEALLVARAFTKDAVNLAKKSRVKLAKVSEEFWPSVTSIRCAGTTHRCHHSNLAIHFTSPTATDRTGPIRNETVCIHEGRSLALCDFIEPIILRHVSGIKRLPSLFDLEGLHPGHAEFSCEFSTGELDIAGEGVTAIDILCDYTLEIRHGKITARFSVEGRGGFARFEYPAGTFGLDKPIVEISAAAPPRGKSGKR